VVRRSAHHPARSAQEDLFSARELVNLTVI
jgi:hypothetical protein